MAQRAIRLTESAGLSTRDQLRLLDDTELVSTFLKGEERGFELLVERYQTRLLNFIYRTVGDRERAEDLVQEVFVRVYRHLARFDRSKKFSTWIYTIASNLAKNELRNRSRNPLVFFQSLAKGFAGEEERPVEFEDTRTRPDDLFHKRHLREVVEGSVARLREIEGKSYEEIAEITRCNLGTVKSRLNRARTAFAALVSPVMD
jgi:RNA polymerase sigma-70 factor (ECF subfamily)